MATRCRWPPELMRIAAHGVGGQTHLLKGGGYSRGNVADAVDLQRSAGAPQGMVGMQRGVRILKHHLHVAPQIALKAGARRNGRPSRSTLPRHSRCNPASTRKIVDLPQPEAPIRLKVSPASTRKLAAETAVFAPNVTCKS